MDNIQFTPLITPLIGDASAVAVAVSGGADSLALALLLHDFCKKHKVRLVALTVDHGLRPEAKEEARFVHELLTKKVIEHHVLTHKSKKATSNLMEHARDLRYGLLTGWCRKHKVKHLAVAHHRDDQAETFLMRLARGSGVDGLSCMAPVSEHDGITILRPLLNTPKPELVAYLKKKKVEWIEDPTNKNPDYTRNRLRHALEECFSTEEKALLDQRLAATAATMQRVKEALEAYTAAALKECVRFKSDTCYLASDIWAAYPAEIRLRLLAEVLRSVGRAEKPLRFEKLGRLHSLLLSGNKIAITLAGCKVEGKMGAVLIKKEK